MFSSGPTGSRSTFIARAWRCRRSNSKALLADQMRRASKSICSNLAEGYGRQKQSKAEFKRFLWMAIGSSDEMRVWARYALDLGYVDEQAWRGWRDEYQIISKQLQVLAARS
jgi:four helix bundle protein